MSEWWANKLRGQMQPSSTPPPPAPYNPSVVPGGLPAQTPHTQTPAPPQGQQFGTDNQGVRQLIQTVGQNAPWEIIMANQWRGGQGAEETQRIGQCPQCGSPRYSGHGDRVFNTETKQFATPALRCIDCGYNSAGYEQIWNSPRSPA